MFLHPLVLAFVVAVGLIGRPAVLPASEQVKLHPIEKYTVVYNFEGMQTGTSTQYNRDWGHLRAEVQDTTTSMMGMTVTNKQRMIVRDDEIVTIDLVTNKATKTRNPMYDRLVNSLRDRDLSGEDLGKEMLTAMGGAPTGETGSYAGESCKWWVVKQVGQQLCLTEDALTLRMEINLGGMSMIQTATEIRRNDGGPDNVFETTGLTIQDAPPMPDLSELLGKMPQPGGNAP